MKSFFTIVNLLLLFSLLALGDVSLIGSPFGLCEYVNLTYRIPRSGLHPYYLLENESGSFCIRDADKKIVFNESAYNLSVIRYYSDREDLRIYLKCAAENNSIKWFSISMNNEECCIEENLRIEEDLLKQTHFFAQIAGNQELFQKLLLLKKIWTISIFICLLLNIIGVALMLILRLPSGARRSRRSGAGRCTPGCLRP